jgi:hypothetical protein
MLYNFDALGSSDDSSDDPAPPPPPVGTDGKLSEVKRLESIRDQKRRELLPLTKSVSSSDPDHQSQLNELSKQIIKVSRAAEEQRQAASDLESKVRTMPSAPPNVPPAKTTPSEVQSEAIKSLRTQNMILKTEIQKTKRALALEGGCKNRALQIKKLRAQLDDLHRVPAPMSDAPPARPTQPVDVQTLKAEVTELERERDALKLKFKGILSRVQTLERGELKERVKGGLELSAQHHEVIERLRPKERQRPAAKRFRAHIGQQSRLYQVIMALNAELVARNRELNQNRVEQGESGIRTEIDRLQTRLHLLESYA